MSRVEMSNTNSVDISTGEVKSPSMVGKLKVHLVLLHSIVLESFRGLIYQVFLLLQANQKKELPYLKVPRDVCL